MRNVLERPRGKMVFADGFCIRGFLTGSGRLPVWGEVVFNTSMTGYQEVITDPSYAGQIVVMTYPQIGNYGVTAEDNEKPVCAARALVVRELSPFFSPAPGRISIEEFMREKSLPGLTGVDTRAITRRIRSQGAVIAAVGRESDADHELLRMARSSSLDREQRLVAGVTGMYRGESRERRHGAAVIDLGVKKSILDQIRRLGVGVSVLDANFDAGEVLAGNFDFVVLSNGPGDPTDIPEVVEQVKRLIGEIPILGICLGHQVVALALGGYTFKLKFGHRGANQPVVDRRTGRVVITSQNHGFAVCDDIAPRTGVEVTYTNANDGTMEGFTDDGRKIECVQFHPEASPGPHDTSFVFDHFLEKVKGWRNAQAM